MPTPSLFPLCDFPPGWVRVGSFDLPTNHTDRLRSMGVFAGQRIEILRSGSPTLIRAAGSRLAISAEIARGIHVEPLPAST